MWFVVIYTIQHFQWSIGIGLVLGFCLMYQYIIIFQWFKKIAVGKLTSPRVEKSISWPVFDLTDSELVCQRIFQ